MPTSVRLGPDTERRLNELVERTGRSKAFYIRELIEQGLEEVEDYYLAVEVLDRVRRGRERVIPLDEVVRDLGLSD